MCRKIPAWRRSPCIFRAGAGLCGGSGRCPEKAECPVRCSQTEVGAPFGAFKVDRSTTGRSTGINLRLDQFTSPVAFTSSSRNWPLWRSGRCRFSGHVASKLTTYPSCHQFTLTRLPVPLKVGANQNRPAERQLGWHPMFGSAPLLRFRAPTRRPTLDPVASPTRPTSRTTLQIPVAACSPKGPCDSVEPDTLAGCPDSVPTPRCSRFTRGCSANPV